MTTVLVLVYLLAFQTCALPAIWRVRQRQSSADLSIWREVLLLVGVSAQLAVMLRTGAKWQVWISPIASGLSVAVMLGHIWAYRR